MANGMIDRYGIPGRVVPGQPKELLNWKMTDANNLRHIVGTRPDVIQGMYKHFAENTGMVTELMQHMRGKSYDADAEKYKKGKGRTNSFEAMQKKFKIMNNMEYAWKTPAPSGFVYRVVESPTFDADSTVGRNGARFQFVINKQLADQDDVFMLADGTTQIIVTQPPTALPDGNLRITARMLFQEGGAGRAIPQRLLERNVELSRIYNIKSEASQHGSKSRVSFGEWQRGWMTTMRWEWNITGHAAHLKMDNTPMMLVYTKENGEVEPYWTETWRYNMMKMSYEQMDNQMFWGLPYIDNQGRFQKNAEGYRYWSGTGIYHQANRRLKREYTRLDSFDVIDDILLGLYYDGLENNQDTEIMVCGGIEFRRQFDQLLRNEFSARPEVLFFDGLGNYHTGDKGKEKGVMGIRSNFTYYETPVGKFIVSKCNYFDRKSHPTLLTAEGRNEQSHRAIMFNISKMIGGNEAMTMVTLSGRQNVLGRIAGMSNPGPGGFLTTARDVEGEHMLTMQGVALHNPNCMGELKLARGRR
jgi:sulfur relay (sulfurtransferase) DsrF/TusC family protein